MRLGHTTRRTVVILWLWTALLSAVVLLPTYTNRGNAIVPLGVAALGLLLYVVFHPGVRSARDLKEVEAAEAADAGGTGDDVVDLVARRHQQEERSGT
jgi:UDP-GlcNAc:undecaprenyl-phosphate GlcNAc-1-phosphate transferase